MHSAKACAMPRDMVSAEGDGPLEVKHFKHFAPLLAACQEYARHSGCRFFMRPFEDSHDEEEVATVATESDNAEAPPKQEEKDELEAQLRAEPVVREFAKRLKSGDRRLLKELRQAFRIAMLEGIRNAMISTCKELGVFPPPELPARSSFAALDDPVPFLLIAQRLYNDEAQRQDQDGHPSHRPQAARQALTSMFLVDFASQVGVPLPDMQEEDQAILHEFSTRAAAWAATQKRTVHVAPEERTLANLDMRQSTLLTTTGVASAAAIGIAASPVAAPAVVASSLVLAVGTGLAAIGNPVQSLRRQWG